VRSPCLFELRPPTLMSVDYESRGPQVIWMRTMELGVFALAVGALGLWTIGPTCRSVVVEIKSII
jgi:hypothetical protein